MQGSPCIITDQPNGEQAFNSSCEPQTQLAIAINLQGGKQTINAWKAGDDDNTTKAVKMTAGDDSGDLPFVLMELLLLMMLVMKMVL